MFNSYKLSSRVSGSVVTEIMKGSEIRRRKEPSEWTSEKRTDQR